MIRILLFLALSLVLCRANDPANDKFDLSITNAALKGNTLELSLKIVNQSAGPVKVDFSAEAVVLKASKDAPSLQVQSVDTRADIYKPRIVLFEPPDHAVFFTSKTSRLFAPKVLGGGESLEITKSITLEPAAFLKDVSVQPYRVFLNLAYRVAPNPDCQATVSSPTYKITADASGKLVLAPE